MIDLGPPLRLARHRFAGLIPRYLQGAHVPDHARLRFVVVAMSARTRARATCQPPGAQQTGARIARMLGIIEVMPTRSTARAPPERLRWSGHRSYDNARIAGHLNGHIDRGRERGKFRTLVHAVEREPHRLRMCAALVAHDHEFVADTTGHSRPDRPERAADRHGAAKSRSSMKTAIRPGRLIVIERRAFVRGCLSCWLGAHFQDLETLAVADAEMSLDPDTLVRTAAVIIGVGIPDREDRWLHRQVAWLRARQPALPIMVIVEGDEVGAAAELGVQLDLQGYIPSFNSLEIAAAAVRLVVAGGSYFPRPREHEARPVEVLPGSMPRTLDLTKVADLTSREWAVVSLLGGGVPNKDIADRLGMSLSTGESPCASYHQKIESPKSDGSGTARAGAATKCRRRNAHCAGGRHPDAPTAPTIDQTHQWHLTTS